MTIATSRLLSRMFHALCAAALLALLLAPNSARAAAPLNDTCVGAIGLPNGVLYAMSTVAATGGDGTPTCRSSFGNGVWFTYVPPVSGTVLVSTCGSDFDTVVQIYTGTCGSLTAVACNDDNGPGCAGTNASVSFSGSAGTVYYILAGGYNSYSGNLEIVALVNDQCDGAVPLAPHTTLAINTADATSTGDPLPSCKPNFGKGVWFTYTPGGAAPTMISTCGSSFDTVLQVYTGNCGALTEVAGACDDDNGPECSGTQASVSFAAVAGVPYHILAGGYNTNGGALQISAKVANDDCSGAISLTAGTPYMMSTADATATGDPLPSCQTVFGKGVWFTYTPASSGPVVVNACGSDFDTVLSVYTGNCGSLTPVACDDDNGYQCPALQSFVAFSGIAGTTYRILAGGYNSQSGTLSLTASTVAQRTLTVNSVPNAGVLFSVSPSDLLGADNGTSSFSRQYADGMTVSVTAPNSDGFNVFQKWQLDGADLTTSRTATITMSANHSLRAVYVAPNDLCGGAIALSLGVPFTMSTAGATMVGDTAPDCGLESSNAVWFTFTPGASGPVVISTCGSDYDTVLQVYSGACGALALVTCNDDAVAGQCTAASGNRTSYAQFMGTAGTTYHIQAAGYHGWTGNLSIAVYMPPAKSVTIASFPNSGLWVGSYLTDLNGVSGGNTPWTGNYASNTVVAFSAPLMDGVNQFIKWQLDGVDYTTSQEIIFTNNANHAIMAIYAPTNDLCAGAIALATGVPYTENTTGATTPGDPVPTCGTGVGKGVWFTYTAPATGVVVISTCGSGFDTVAQAYSGTCGALTAINCNDDAGLGQCPSSSFNSCLEFMGTAAITYHILVGGWSGDSGNLSIVANVQPAVPLTVNSSPSNGVYITMAPTDTGGNGSGFTSLSRTYAMNTVVALNAPLSDGFNVFKKWTRNGVDYATNTVTNVTVSAVFTMTAVYGPPNDDCTGAIALATGMPYTEDTTTASTSGDPVGICGLDAGKGIWFTYTPSANGVVSINSCGSDFDTVLQAYTGACGALTSINCNDDAGAGQCPTGSTASDLEFMGTAGTTYHILGGGYYEASGHLKLVATVNPATTLVVNSSPHAGVNVSAKPTDVNGLGGGPTSLVLTHAVGTVVTVEAPTTDGFNYFQKWQLDGADYSVGSATTVALGSSHTLTAVYVPPNDQCSGAIALAAGVPYLQNTAGATSTGDPVPACQVYGTNGVWFTFTPATSGVVTVSTCPSDYDTILQAYTGTCGALAPVANGCDDDTLGYCSDRQSFVQFPGTAGTVYHILASGYLGATGNLNITANVGAARTLTVNSLPFPGVGSFYTVPTDATGTSSGVTVFSQTHADGVTVQVWAPLWDGLNNQFQKWQLNGVDYATGNQVNVPMTNSQTLTAVYVPANDQCAGAILLTNGISFSMNNSTATETGDPLVPCSTLAKGVWFKYVPAADEEVTVQTCGSSFDTALQVFTGTCGALQRVTQGCNDDSGPSCDTLQASTVYSGHAGVTNYILVGGWAGNSGTITITVTSGLVNDSCVAALPLFYGIPFTMTTINATSTGDGAPLCQPNFGKGVWFKFVAPFTGPIPISTCGSSFDSVLEVYTNICGGLIPIACADDDGPLCSGNKASLILNATNNTIYYVLAGGWNNYSGTLRIMVGTLPVLTVNHAGTIVQPTWPSYYSPRYVLQREVSPSGINLGGTWEDQLPNVWGPMYNATNPATFFRLITP